jgi:hypothetical protein
MLDLVSFLFAIGVGFGLSFWVFGTLLDKSNNIGDSKGAQYEYDTEIQITSRTDKMSKSESESYIHYHAVIYDDDGQPKGTDLARRLSKEELEEYKKKETAPRGAYVSKDDRNEKFKTAEDEFEEWEKNNQSTGTMAGVFKPLSQDNQRNPLD